jgi:hypothetical protein
MSTSTEYMDGLKSPIERRFYPRVAPPSPIWVAFGPNNTGVLHDLSENGFQITTPDGLALNSVYRVLIPLKNSNSKTTIVVTVRTIWTNDDENRSGIQLLDLSEEDRRHVRQLVVSELARYEAEAPASDEAPVESQSPAPQVIQNQGIQNHVIQNKPPQNKETAEANSWPAEWQREDWQNIDVEHPPVEEVSAFGPSSRTEQLLETPLLATEPELEQQPEIAAHYRVGVGAGGDADVEKAEVPETKAADRPAELETADDREAVTEASVASQIDAPAPEIPTHFFERLGQQPPPRADFQPYSSASATLNFAGEPVAAQANAATDAGLPPIANPFDEPGPNSRFQQFPSVPLPIHGEFEYVQARASRRRPSLSSRLHAKPLILWAAVLALVCFGANALVRYKINQTSQRFAAKSSVHSESKSDAATADNAAPADDSSASATAPSSAPDAQPDETSNSDAGSVSSKNQSTSPAQPDTSSSSVTPSSPAGVRNSGASRTASSDESSLDARANRAYAATAPPTSDLSVQTGRASQPAATTRSWTSPAPSPSSSTASASDAPQSPNVQSSSNVETQPASTPIVSQTRSTPPPAAVQPVQVPATSTASNSTPTSNPNTNAANNTVARTQATSNSQPSTYASSSNATQQSRPQSPIYNANAPGQRSAIIGSINQVHSSGIFESNDSNASSAQPASAPASASRGGNSNTNIAPRPVANSSVVPADVPQDRDLEIVAPKGFNASWVDLPGEHVVRAPTGTVHIHRLVRVPGERVPGQRWLWRAKVNVTLGDVVNRIDPAVVQASGASGSLTVLASIDKDGYVTDLKPLNGNFALLPAVSRTVRNWHYQPTYLDNKRTETEAQIEFDLHPIAATPNRTAQR